MTLENEKSWTWKWTSTWNFGQSCFRDGERKRGSEEGFKRWGVRVTFEKRYRAHKNGDVAAQREQLPEEEQSRGEREREERENVREI